MVYIEIIEFIEIKIEWNFRRKKKHFFILFLIHSSLYLLEELLEISRYNDIPMASVVVFVIVVTVNMPVYYSGYVNLFNI